MSPTRKQGRDSRRQGNLEVNRGPRPCASGSVAVSFPPGERVAFSAIPPTLSSLPFLSTSRGMHVRFLSPARRQVGVIAHRCPQRGDRYSPHSCNRGPAKPKVAVVTNNAFQFWQFAKRRRPRGRGQAIRHRRRGQDAAPRQRRGARSRICEDLLVRGIKESRSAQRRRQHGRVLQGQEVAPPLCAVRDDR